MKRRLQAAATLFLSLSCVAPLACAQCGYPAAALGEAGQSARNQAAAEYRRYESLRDQDVVDACVLPWQKYLNNLAFVLKIAGDRNPRDRRWFHDRELTVRDTLSLTFDGASVPGGAISIYRNNVERKADLYQASRDHARLFDAVQMDRHFEAQWRSLPTTRRALRLAIYSCNRWDFTHPDDLRNKHADWRQCQLDFARLARNPSLREIAPDAFDFFDRQWPSSATARTSRQAAMQPEATP